MLRLTQTDKDKPILVNTSQIIAVRERKGKAPDTMVSVVKMVDGKEYEVTESLTDIEAQTTGT